LTPECAGRERVEMDRKVVTGITLAMLFIGILPLAFKVQPVAAPATVDWWSRARMRKGKVEKCI
jgi:hypothetical protein